MNKQLIRNPNSSGNAGKQSRIRYFAANCALIAGLIGCGVLFVWTIMNPRHLPSNTIYAIVFLDYLVGLTLLVILLVRVSANQSLDAPTTAQPVHWESDFQSWSTSLGIRLLATDKQLQVLRQLFDLGNCIDNSVSPPRLDETKRQAMLKLIQQSHSEAGPGGPNSKQETQVLFSALQYGDRYQVTAILRELRRLGNSALVPRIYSAPIRAPGKDVPAIHFEEIRATAHQCANVLSALAILHADQDTLLRASSAEADIEQTVLVRPAAEVESREEELLRSANTQNKTPP